MSTAVWQDGRWQREGDKVLTNCSLNISLLQIFQKLLTTECFARALMGQMQALGQNLVYLPYKSSPLSIVAVLDCSIIHWREPRRPGWWTLGKGTNFRSGDWMGIKFSGGVFGWEPLKSQGWKLEYPRVCERQTLQVPRSGPKWGNQW